jgi:DNA polymerase III subunit beta
MTVETKTESVRIQADVQILANAMRQVVFAAAEESLRYCLHGVRFEYRNGELTLVATDGRRLAYRTIAATAYSTDSKPLTSDALEFTLPRTIAKQFCAKVTKTARGNVDVNLDSEILPVNCTMQWNGANRKPKAIETRLLEGRYPDWRQIVDSAKPKTTLAGLAGQVAEIIDPVVGSAAWNLDANGKVELKREPVTLSRVLKKTGRNVDVTFNIELLHDWLATLGEKTEFTIGIEHAEKAVCCESSESSYVFMPLAQI